MAVNKFIYVLFILVVSTQFAYADYYTQSLSIGSDKNEFTENYVKTPPDDEKNSQSAIVEYVQPVIYPVQYTPTQIIYRNDPYMHNYNYPYSYFNYNNGGLSVGYNSNPSAINPRYNPGYNPGHDPGHNPNPINPIQPPPPNNTNGQIKMYQTGTSFGLERTPKLLLYDTQPKNKKMHPHY